MPVAQVGVAVAVPHAADTAKCASYINVSATYPQLSRPQSLSPEQHHQHESHPQQQKQQQQQQ